MIRRPPRSTQPESSAASDVYKRQVDGDGFRNHLLRNFGIEIGNGLGELSGKVWRGEC